MRNRKTIILLSVLCVSMLSGCTVSDMLFTKTNNIENKEVITINTNITEDTENNVSNNEELVPIKVSTNYDDPYKKTVDRVVIVEPFYETIITDKYEYNLFIDDYNNIIIYREDINTEYVGCIMKGFATVDDRQREWLAELRYDHNLISYIDDLYEYVEREGTICHARYLSPIVDGDYDFSEGAIIKENTVLYPITLKEMTIRNCKDEMGFYRYYWWQNNKFINLSDYPNMCDFSVF